MLSFANIIICTAAYGGPACGPWLQMALRVLFFIYMSMGIVMAFCLNMVHYTYRMGQSKSNPIVRVLPFFPAMLAGTVGSAVVQGQPQQATIDITIAAVAVQGLGFLASLFVLCEYFQSLSHNGLLPPDIRPQMFIAVGPFAFTVVALLSCAMDAVRVYPAHFIKLAPSVNTMEVIVIVAAFISVFLWLMAFFACFLAVSALLAGYRSCHFSLAWWSCIFPNCGFTIATVRIGDVLDSEGILWVGSAMTIIIAAAWVFLTSFTLWEIYYNRLLGLAEKQQ